MGQITFEHSGCNGWAIYDSTDIDADNAKNIHVAEGTITKNWGETKFRPNSALATICGKKLKRQNRQNLLCSENPAAIRSRLADLQNNGKEVCGTCASHFYADPE